MGRVINPLKDKPMKGTLIILKDKNSKNGSKVRKRRNGEVICLALSKSIRQYVPWRKFKK